jgi:imidazole glycerol-phosphate synthase subunit HisH
MKSADMKKITIIDFGLGWNTAMPRAQGGLFQGMETLNAGGRFYFLHSYFFQCRVESDVLAETDYGGNFCSAVRSGHIYGVQFHPEKSHIHGMQLLKNFGEMP